MKKLSLIGIALWSLVACDSAPKGYYEVEGHIRGVEDGVVLTLFRINGQAGMGIDHDTLRDGRFFFRVKPEEAKREHMTLLAWRDDFPSMALHFWAGEGDRVTIEGDDKLIYSWEVEGPAPENRSWQAYNACARDLYDELQRVTIEENQIRLRGQEPEADPTRLQAQYDSLGRLQQEVLIPQIHARQIEHMRRVKMDQIGLMHLEEMARLCKYDPEGYPHREAVVELYNALDEEWLHHPTAERIRAQLYPVKVVAKGKPMVDGELYDLKGRPHTLSELHGQYILLDFWSAGCGPCMMALPEMGEIAKRYADRLQVVSITTDGDAMWRKTSADHPISWHNWSDGKEQMGIYRFYDQTGIPNYTLISPEGIVLDRWMGYGSGSLKLKIAEHLQ